MLSFNVDTYTVMATGTPDNLFWRVQNTVTGAIEATFKQAHMAHAHRDALQAIADGTLASQAA